MYLHIYEILPTYRVHYSTFNKMLYNIHIQLLSRFPAMTSQDAPPSPKAKGSIQV
jgi:hypothetical protein